MGGLAWNLREKADFQPVAAAAREGHRANGANSHHVIVYERPTVLSDCGAETEAKRDAQAGELVSAPKGRALIMDTASPDTELVKVLRPRLGGVRRVRGDQGNGCRRPAACEPRGCV